MTDLIPHDFPLDAKGEALRAKLTALVIVQDNLQREIAAGCLELERLRQEQWFAKQEEKL